MKHRSLVNYALIYAGDKQGYNLGLDGAIFIKRESIPRTFEKPSIGTQGKSEGDAAASTDISAHATPATLKVTVSGGAQVTASIAVAGLTTGVLIAAALETAINNALSADGQDARVWVEYDSGDDHYVVWNQSTGVAATVVIANGTSNNIADDLKLGLANGGTESAGTDDADFLLYTTGGPTFNQPIESSQHRSGRSHKSIIKQKKVAEHSISSYVNMSGSAGDSIDAAVSLMWEQLLGVKEVTAGVKIAFKQGIPGFYYSLVRVSTIFGEYYTGGYNRELALEFPGDGPATCAWAGKLSDRKIAGLSQINGAVSASSSVVVNAGQFDRYDVGARVMIVSPDGRTIVAGADGSLTVDSITELSNTLGLSASVTVADDGYVVPWHPGAVQQSARDNIFTDLVGSFKLSSGGSAIDVSNISLNFNNDHVDLDGYFGADANKGFVAGNRMTAELSVTFDLSNENFAEVVQSSKFEGFSPEIVLGSASGRRLKITMPKWIPQVPPIEVPENGTTPITLTGICYQSAAGKDDAVLVEFL